MNSLPANLDQSTVNYCKQFKTTDKLLKGLENNKQHVSNLANAILKDEKWGKTPENSAFKDKVFTMANVIQCEGCEKLTKLDLSALPEPKQKNLTKSKEKK